MATCLGLPAAQTCAVPLNAFETLFLSLKSCQSNVPVLRVGFSSLMLCTSLSVPICTGYYTQFLCVCCAGSRLPPQAAARTALPTAPTGEVIDYYELLGVRALLHCISDSHLAQEDTPHALVSMKCAKS